MQKPSAALRSIAIRLIHASNAFRAADTRARELPETKDAINLTAELADANLAINDIITHVDNMRDALNALTKS